MVRRLRARPARSGLNTNPLIRRLADLPLVWKLLVPYFVLVLLVGVGGSLLLIADLQQEAETDLDQRLLQASLTMRASLKDRELYLLEAANFAANVEGMSRAVSASDTPTVSKFMNSAVALKSDLQLLAVINTSEISISEVSRRSADQPLTAGSGTHWSYQIVKSALKSEDGSRSAGFIPFGNEEILSVVAPICSALETCAPVGAVLLGVFVESLATEAASAIVEAGSEVGIRIYDADGRIIGSHGTKSGMSGPPSPPSTVRVFERDSASNRVGTLFAPLELQSSVRGTMAVSMPATSMLDVVKGAAVSLGALIFAVLAGITLIGVGLSRLILRQLEPLLQTSQSLERGDLQARTPVLGTDELGRLAEVMNQMAGELETSHRGLEERVAERTAEVERLLEERTRFFASISHEFRTPLATILSEAKMMIRPKRQRSRSRDVEAAKAIEQSGEQLLRAINDIIELTRTETRTVEILLTEVSVSASVRDWRRALESLAASRGVKLTFRVRKDLPVVVADPIRLREVLTNLVDNALKYTPEGGRVLVTAEANSRHVHIAVEDSGPGIPKEIGDRIFEPFFRVPGLSTQHGEPASGLGLAIAKRLIEAQGGSIDYSSEQGRGSRFRVTLQRVHPLGNANR